MNRIMLPIVGLLLYLTVATFYVTYEITKDDEKPVSVFQKGQVVCYGKEKGKILEVYILSQNSFIYEIEFPERIRVLSNDQINDCAILALDFNVYIKNVKAKNANRPD